MKYIALILMFCSCYYTFTYGVVLWKKDNNKLAGSATILLSLISFIIPAITLFIKF